jgi:hypothetical protein
MRKGCHGHSIRGSGYVKPEADSANGKKMSEDLQKLLEARTSQDTRYFPTATSLPLSQSLSLSLSPSVPTKNATGGTSISHSS